MHATSQSRHAARPRGQQGSRCVRFNTFEPEPYRADADLRGPLSVLAALCYLFLHQQCSSTVVSSQTRTDLRCERSCFFVARLQHDPSGANKPLFCHRRQSWRGVHTVHRSLFLKPLSACFLGYRRWKAPEQNTLSGCGSSLYSSSLVAQSWHQTSRKTQLA